MRLSRLRRQDGYFREILWVALVIAIIAVVLLDGVSIFNGYRGIANDAGNAADAARTEYSQTADVDSAKNAAETFLIKQGDKLVGFETGQATEGGTSFTVTAKTHSQTYVFKYFRYIPGLKSWVNGVINPTSTQTKQ